MAYYIKYAPRGFSGGPALELSDKEVQSGDPNVMILYREFVNPGFETRTWLFKRSVVELALRVFDRKRGFDFAEQDHNAHLSGFNYKFLLDTLRYIATGRRSMDVHMWGDLMEQTTTVPEHVVVGRSAILNRIAEYKLDMKPTALIQQWLTHKDGLEDLIITMHLMFGDRVVQSDNRTGLSQATGVQE